jgi:hypothetical protein
MAAVTLSFDNGPDVVVTPQVLDILAREASRRRFSSSVSVWRPRREKR